MLVRYCRHGTRSRPACLTASVLSNKWKTKLALFVVLVQQRIVANCVNFLAGANPCMPLGIVMTSGRNKMSLGHTCTVRCCCPCTAFFTAEVTMTLAALQQASSSAFWTLSVSVCSHQQLCNSKKQAKWGVHSTSCRYMGCCLRSHLSRISQQCFKGKSHQPAHQKP